MRCSLAERETCLRWVCTWAWKIWRRDKCAMEVSDWLRKTEVGKQHCCLTWLTLAHAGGTHETGWTLLPTPYVFSNTHPVLIPLRVTSTKFICRQAILPVLQVKSPPYGISWWNLLVRLPSVARTRRNSTSLIVTFEARR